MLRIVERALMVVPLALLLAVVFVQIGMAQRHPTPLQVPQDCTRGGQGVPDVVQATEPALDSPCGRLERALLEAGWPEGTLPEILAVARAESGCRPEATCRDCGRGREHSVGPFQINLLAHSWVGEGCARDPACASRAALRISRGGTFLRPWTAYRTGAYRVHLGRPEPLDTRP